MADRRNQRQQPQQRDGLRKSSRRPSRAMPGSTGGRIACRCQRTDIPVGGEPQRFFAVASKWADSRTCELAACLRT
jgi:hypothetical protein